MDGTLLPMIDNIDVVTEAAELDVMCALSNAYTKEFKLYQEGKFLDDVNAPIKGKDGESTIKKILMFIPRLIAKIIRMISRLIQHKKRTDMRSLIRNNLKSLAGMQAAELDDIKSFDDFIKAIGIELDKWYDVPGGFRYKYTIAYHADTPFSNDPIDALVIVCHGMVYDTNKMRMKNMIFTDDSKGDDELNAIFKKHNVDSEYAKSLYFYFDTHAGTILNEIAKVLQKCVDNMKKIYVERIDNDRSFVNRMNMHEITGELMRARKAIHVMKNSRSTAIEFYLYNGLFETPKKDDGFMNMEDMRKRLQNINSTFLIFKDKKVLEEIQQYCNDSDKALDSANKYNLLDGYKWHGRKSYDDFESSVSLFTEILSLFSAEIAFNLTTRSKIDATENAVLAQLKENKKEEIKRDVLNA